MVAEACNCLGTMWTQQHTQEALKRKWLVPIPIGDSDKISDIMPIMLTNVLRSYDYVVPPKAWSPLLCKTRISSEEWRSHRQPSTFQQLGDGAGQAASLAWMLLGQEESF